MMEREERQALVEQGEQLIVSFEAHEGDVVANLGSKVNDEIADDLESKVGKEEDLSMPCDLNGNPQANLEAIDETYISSNRDEIIKSVALHRRGTSIDGGSGNRSKQTEKLPKEVKPSRKVQTRCINEVSGTLFL